MEFKISSDRVKKRKRWNEVNPTHPKYYHFDVSSATELVYILLLFQVSVHTSHISSAQRPYVAGASHFGQLHPEFS